LPPSPSPPPPSPSPPPPSPSPPAHSPPPACIVDTFTTRDSLKTALKEFNSNAASAIAKYGPIADWCVSAITEMTTLFYNLKNFNADIFGWDTSSVTTMHYMFWVRAPRVPLAPKP
jgi:surface protein